MEPTPYITNGWAEVFKIMASERAKKLAEATTFQIDPDAQPYKPGFWAVDYDPTQAQWGDTESELSGFDVNVRERIGGTDYQQWDTGAEDVPNIMPSWGSQVHRGSGFGQSPTWGSGMDYDTTKRHTVKDVTYGEERPSSIKATALSDAPDTSVDKSDFISNWKVNTERALQELIKIEETDPTSRLQEAGQFQPRKIPGHVPFEDLPKGAKWPEPPADPQAVETSGGDNNKHQDHHEYYIYRVRLGQKPNSADKASWHSEDEFRKLENKILNIGQRKFSEFMPDAKRVLDLNIIKATEYLGTHPKDRNDPILAYGPQGYVPPRWFEDQEFIKRGLIGYDSSAGQYITGGSLGPLITTDKAKQATAFDKGTENWASLTGENVLSQETNYNVRIDEGNQPELERGTAIHEPIHHVQNVLSQTMEYWKDVEFRGQKLADILAPIINGKREWDRAANHIVNYANSSDPRIYTRISTWYGSQVNTDGTPNTQYVEIFSKSGDPDKTVGEPEKYKIADELSRAINEAARLVADAYENNPNFRLTTAPPDSIRQ